MSGNTENIELGIVSLKPEGPFVAGSRPVINLTYNVGRIEIKAGGCIRVNLPPDSWTAPVWLDSIWREYYKPVNVKVDIESPEKIQFKLKYDFEGVFAQMLVIEITEGVLRDGDKLLLTYGYQEYGSKGIQVQTFPERDLEFVDENFDIRIFAVSISRHADAEWEKIPQCPKISVIAGPPEHLNIVAPSRVRQGDNFRLKMSWMDKCRNRPEEKYHGRIELKYPEKISASEKLEFTESDDNRMQFETTLNNSGVSRIEIIHDGKRMQSNPILVGGESSMNLYWGEIHGHSKLSDGAGDPDEFYRYGKEVACLDICALSDHEVCFRERDWAKAQELACKYYQPGEFVTLKAFEWTSNIYGHYNVYYRDTEIEPVLAELKSMDVGFSLKTSVLIDFLKDKDVLIIPHHTLVATQWDTLDPRMRLVEIYSCWGRSEYPGNPGWDKRHNPWGGVQKALDKGYKLGIIAGSDTHDGLPGRCYPGNRASNLNFKGGLMAVYAPELTREAVFDSMFKRHCYGTTGERIILDFKVNGHCMGSEIKYKTSGARTIETDAVGTSKILKVEIIRNAEVLASFKGKSDCESFEYLDEDRLIPGNPFYYYVRVTQDDGEMAWSSPVWTWLSEI